MTNPPSHHKNEVNSSMSVDELREQILIEFKQVHKLAPADYTENCTNVVMNLIHQYVTKKQIEELEDAECCKHGYGEACSHLADRIAELEKQLEGGDE